MIVQKEVGPVDKRMKRLLVFLLIVSGSFGVSAQDIDEIAERYLNAEEYKALIPELKELNDEFYKDNSWKIDYMLASCYCKTEEYKTGADVFLWMKDEYDLTEELRDLLTSKAENCTLENLVADLVAQSTSTNGTSGFSGISSKEIRLEAYSEKGAQSLRASEHQKHDDIDFSERIIVKENKTKFRKELRKRPGLSSAVKTAHLLVFGSMREENLEKLGEELEKSLLFFSTEFNLKIPEAYIQVNVFESLTDLNTFADEYHRVLLAEYTYGYTFDDDLSISGYIPPHLYAGTLQHELFHLLTHYNLKKMPFWMEEGLAALYEGAEFSGDKLLGYTNWRGEVIRKYGSQYLWEESFSLVNLMNGLNWTRIQEGTDNSEEARKQQVQSMVHLAIFRYMFIYMQNEGYLSSFFEKIRHRKTFEREGFYEMAIEEATKKSPDQFQAEFLTWLKSELE